MAPVLKNKLQSIFTSNRTYNHDFVLTMIDLWMKILGGRFVDEDKGVWVKVEGT